MPILETKVLTSKIKINYQEGEKEKLINLIELFNLRLSEFKELKEKFSDNKIIFLVALKAEDQILDLNKKLESQKKTIKSSINIQENIDSKTREAVVLKDQISSLKEKNQALKEENETIINEINEINKKLIILIDKILNINDDDN